MRLTLTFIEIKVLSYGTCGINNIEVFIEKEGVNWIEE